MKVVFAKFLDIKRGWLTEKDQAGQIKSEILMRYIENFLIRVIKLNIISENAYR